MTQQSGRTQSTQHCVWGWFLRLLILVVLLAVGENALGQQTGPRPGETDPLGKSSRYTLFPDQELLAVLAHDPATAGLNAEFSFNSFAPSADLKNLTPLGGATNVALDLRTANMRAAAGRILAPERDQVVYARRTTGSNLAIAFLGYPNSTTTLSPLANQPPGITTDVFDIAVGDLDKSADSDGNNHDEVVVCFATSPTNAVQVAVLDYTASTPAPSDAVRPQATTTAIATTLKLNDVQSVDAVLACTIGDFDGDGQNEIAVVGLYNRLLSVNLLRYGLDKGKPVLFLASAVAFTIDLELVGSVGVTALVLPGPKVEVRGGDYPSTGINPCMRTATSFRTHPSGTTSSLLVILGRLRYRMARKRPSRWCQPHVTPLTAPVQRFN